jgi:hypothetical protein
MTSTESSDPTRKATHAYPVDLRGVEGSALLHFDDPGAPCVHKSCNGPQNDDVLKPIGRRSINMRLTHADSTVRATATFLALLTAGCADHSPAAPSRGALVTFAVGSETFRVSLTSADQVIEARAAQSGERARIPNGLIVAGTQANTGWTWHLEGVMFVETAVELCDGRPSDVERQGIGFGGGRFCPWAATVIQIEEN